MKNYIGIDLGTTNSAICSFDGENLRIYKSPDQNDVTPSAIFIDRRGNKYLGSSAYRNAARNPDNAAIRFKRIIGTSTPVKLSAVNITMTPEECSAEILKVCFGYLPEEIRNSNETGTVITVPAAFNQMQKDATMAAADLAGLGKVALMQEPVAAVMSVMRQRKGDGLFLIYDLGGGTLDIAIAQSISGRVSLLAHGGIAMCGGADFDRFIVDNLVRPWLLEKFKLPNDFTVNEKYKVLVRMCTWAAEKAKIELSAKNDAIIQLPETDLGVRDESNNEMYLDIEIKRSDLDALIAEKITESIQSARETMEKAGLTSHDIERIVFVGGPTHYKPLRDKVAFELGIAASTEVNPMTAVAEGAAVFAESIDWNSQSRGRKSTRGAISADGKLELTFNYVARTPDSKAKIAVKLGGKTLPGAEFKIDNLDNGTESARIPLKDGATTEVVLSKPGENTFKIWVFDAKGGPVTLEKNKIVITRTAATIYAIPSSASIGIEALDKVGGQPVLDYLVREGDPLPAEGRKKFKAGESLRAGSTSSLRIPVWEGEIKDPIKDNRYIGTMKITGNDFEEGVISQGEELICDYKVLDSGNIILEVSIPKIGNTFHSGRNFYARQDGQLDYSDASKQVLEEAESVRERIDAVSSKVDDPKLKQAIDKLEQASSVKSGKTDPEDAKKAMDNVLAAKKILAQVRQQHQKEIRQLDLDRCLEFFNSHVKQHARPAEITAFDTLARTAQRAIDSNSNDFENMRDQLRGKNFQILWRQDWFIVERFKWLAEDVYLFPDKIQHKELVVVGAAAIQADDMEKLRRVVYELDSLRIGSGSDDDMLASTNIIRG